MHVLLNFSATVDWLNTRVYRLLVWLILACVLVSALAATLRYTLSWGSNALLEAQWYMFGLVFLLCSPYTLKEQGHVRIDILSSRLAPRVRVWIDILGGLLFLLPVCVLITVDSWKFFRLAYQQNEASFNPGGLLWWPIKLAIPIGFALLALQGMSEVIKGAAALRGLRPLPEFKESH